MSLIQFVSHTELNNLKTDITESDFFGNNCQYHTALIANLHILLNACCS